MANNNFPPPPVVDNYPQDPYFDYFDNYEMPDYSKQKKSHLIRNILIIVGSLILAVAIFFALIMINEPRHEEQTVVEDSAVVADEVAIDTAE